MKWYAINPESGSPVLPPLEDYETTISVDVLVFGFFNNAARQAFFGIGYTQGYREATWHVNTSNGAYDVPGDEEVTLLMWASLPDEPAEVPPGESVKNNDQNVNFAPRYNAEKPAGLLASLNTQKLSWVFAD